MGWLFGWDTRKQLIDHLVANKGGGKVQKHCCVGNNLWMTVEYERRPGHVDTLIVLCMMRRGHGHGPEWGYKDVSEDMGPCNTTCPVSYLESCTAPPNKYAYDWRQAVYALNRNAKQLKVGSKWHVSEKSVATVLKRRSPTAFLIDLDGNRFRCGIRYLLGRDAA